MHGQRLLPDADGLTTTGLAAETLVGVIIDAAERLDRFDRDRARLMLCNHGIAGESLRDLTDADMDALCSTPDHLSERLDELVLSHTKARQDMLDASMKEGLNGFA